MKKIVFVLCLLLLLSACGREGKKTVPLSETAAEEKQVSTAFSFSVSEAYALSLLRDSLPSDCPFSVENLTFSASRGVVLSGRADLQALCALCDISYPDFLPETVSFSSSAQVGFRNGEIELSPEELTVAGLPISLEKCPAFLYSSLEEKLNDYLSSLSVRIRDIQIENQSLHIVG